MEAKEHYKLLKENNELEELLITTTGEWEEDKQIFTKYYNENVKFIMDFEKDMDEWELEDD